MNTVTLKNVAPRIIRTKDMKPGQYAIIDYSGEQVIGVKLVTDQFIGLDGHHTFDSTCDMPATLLGDGETITIVCGEQS